jgi:CheY-like chemotaxis protein
LPDSILCDIFLPDTDRIEVVNALPRRKPLQPEDWQQAMAPLLGGFQAA